MLAARKWASAQDLMGRIEFVAIDGVKDPTNHEQILDAVGDWIKSPKDPLEVTKKKRKRIQVNLSPGTPSMHAAWMMLKWRGTFRNADVHFYQGDGGADSAKGQHDSERTPMRPVPFDVLTRYIYPGSSAVEGASAPEENHSFVDQLESSATRSSARRSSRRLNSVCRSFWLGSGAVARHTWPNIITKGGRNTERDVRVMGNRSRLRK